MRQSRPKFLSHDLLPSIDTVFTLLQEEECHRLVVLGKDQPPPSQERSAIVIIIFLSFFEWGVWGVRLELVDKVYGAIVMVVVTVVMDMDMEEVDTVEVKTMLTETKFIVHAGMNRHNGE